MILMDPNSFFSDEVRQEIKKLIEEFQSAYNAIDDFFQNKVKNGVIKQEDIVEYNNLMRNFHEALEMLKLQLCSNKKVDNTDNNT